MDSTEEYKRRCWAKGAAHGVASPRRGLDRRHRVVRGYGREGLLPRYCRRPEYRQRVMTIGRRYRARLATDSGICNGAKDACCALPILQQFHILTQVGKNGGETSATLDSSGKTVPSFIQKLNSHLQQNFQSPVDALGMDYIRY